MCAHTSSHCICRHTPWCLTSYTYRFCDRFLASSFGLVGRTDMQPRQLVYTLVATCRKAVAEPIQMRPSATVYMMQVSWSNRSVAVYSKSLDGCGSVSSSSLAWKAHKQQHSQCWICRVPWPVTVLCALLCVLSIPWCLACKCFRTSLS